MGEGPMKQMVSDAPRWLHETLLETLGKEAKTKLITWWPKSTFQAEFSIQLGDTCIASGRNNDRKLVTEMRFKEEIEYNGKQYSGEKIAKMFDVKVAQRTIFYECVLRTTPIVERIGKEPKKKRAQ